MHHLDSASSRRLRGRLGAACLAIALSLTLVLAALAGPAELLDEARGHFDFGEYQKARELAARAIAAGTLSGAALRSAHALAGQCELELADEAAARAAFCAAWKADPAWDPSKEEYRRPELDAIERARLECATGAAPDTSKDRDSKERKQPSADRSEPGSTQQDATKRNESDLTPSGQRTDSSAPPTGQAEIRRKSWYQRPLTWVGGLAVAAGAIVLMGGGGGSDDPGDGGTPPLDDFPAPPDPPR